MGAPYATEGGFAVRRVILQRTGYHLYFGLKGNDLVILSVWGARRGRGR
jgi:hypothetical protein